MVATLGLETVRERGSPLPFFNEGSGTMRRVLFLVMIFSAVVILANPVDIEISPPIFGDNPLVDNSGNLKKYLLSGEMYSFSLILTFNEKVDGAVVKFEFPKGTEIYINESDISDDGKFSIDTSRIKFTPFSLKYDISFRLSKESDEIENIIFGIKIENGQGKVLSKDLKIPFKLGPSRRVICGDTKCIVEAMRSAKPGYLIELKPGVYEGKVMEINGKSVYFHISANGEEDLPIIFRSLDPSSPAVLQGETTDKGYGLYITGDNIILEDIVVRRAQKGIVMDNASWNVLKGCEVYEIGDEGIHVRDGSSHNLITKCWIHDTGRRKGRKGYGEGIYIGSAWKTVKKYGYYPVCSYNTIRENRIGPGVTAEHIDVKEFTFGTLIENNVFYGRGISGEHYADSFIDLKGNTAVVRWNIFYRQGNEKIKDAIQVHDVVKNGDWGYGNVVYGNVFFMDTEDGYMVNAPTGFVYVFENVRIPEGKDYKGKIRKEEE